MLRVLRFAAPTLTPRSAALALLALVPAQPAQSQTDPLFALTQAVPDTSDPGLFPAAQCAALWYGQDDYAAVSNLMEKTPGSLELAGAFRQIAVRLTTQGPEAVDRFIASQRPMMTFLVESYVFGGDEQSRKFYEKLLEDCDAFAATQPETKALR